MISREPARAPDLAGEIASRLAGRTVACAESCTAGRLAEEFAAVEAASDWFRGGLVAYQTTIKRALLGVEMASVLNEEAAAEMAIGVAELMDADVAVSTTGVAGDSPEEGVPPGTVFIATYVDGHVRVATHRFDGNPEAICAAARDQALEMLLRHLDEHTRHGCRTGPSERP